MSMFTAYSSKWSINNHIQLRTIFRVRIVVIPPYLIIIVAQWIPRPYTFATPRFESTPWCTTFWRFFFGAQTIRGDLIRIFTPHCIGYVRVKWCCVLWPGLILYEFPQPFTPNSFGVLSQCLAAYSTFALSTSGAVGSQLNQFWAKFSPWYQSKLKWNLYGTSDISPTLNDTNNHCFHISQCIHLRRGGTSSPYPLSIFYQGCRLSHRKSFRTVQALHNILLKEVYHHAGFFLFF